VSYELMPAAASVSFSVKVVVPKAAAGAVIGKGGDFINSLRTATGARIAMTESALDKPDLDRVVRFPAESRCVTPYGHAANPSLYCDCTTQVTLTGQFMQIMNAFKPILEKMVAHQDPPAEVPGNCTVKLQLSNEQAGCLIGKGGAVINGIRTGAGVAVHIDSHKDAAVLSPMMVRVLILKGWVVVDGMFHADHGSICGLDRRQQPCHVRVSADCHSTRKRCQYCAA
jgi:predicted RNA-binding protein YlqC (UPF0109 family)